jgi:hypothetical protein
MRRLGPDLKVPKLRGGDLKVPPFLSDLYFDLKDRRLLPILVLVLVAIVAAPFLLGGGAEELEPAPAPNPIVAPSAKRSSLTVVEAQPGLRNYKKRLARHRPSDPFQQRFTAPVLKGQEERARTPAASTSSTTSFESSGASSGSGFVAPPSAPVEPAPADPPSGGNPPGGNIPGDDPSHGGDPLPGALVYYAFAADLQITRIEPPKDGANRKEAPSVRKEVLPPTPLPGPKAPVATYIGISPKTQKPLFVVSPDVTSTFGEGKCVAGTDSCQLMEVEPGFPVTFVYGENGVRYKFNVTKVEPVVTGDPKRDAKTP